MKPLKLAVAKLMKFLDPRGVNANSERCKTEYVLERGEVKILLKVGHLRQFAKDLDKNFAITESVLQEMLPELVASGVVAGLGA